MTYRLTCLICGEYHGNDLVAIQEHAMREHDYRQRDHQRVTRREVDGGWVYTMPDGVDWLLAKRDPQP
jgi:hypothetical protein